MSILLAALFLSAQPVAQAPAAAPAAPAPVAAEKPKKEKKICRADPTETGSHMVKRICMTQEQWDAQRGRTTDEFNASMPGAH
jgi:Spy/CpxP family protein refolding chaperone